MSGQNKAGKTSAGMDSPRPDQQNGGQGSISIRKSSKSRKPNTTLPQVSTRNSSLSASLLENAQTLGDLFSQANYRDLVRTVISSIVFDAVIGSVIALNAITIGLELTFEIDGIDTGAINILEHIFLCIYILELAARLYAFGWTAALDKWVQLDAFLVCLGIFTNWILAPALGADAANSLGPLMTLRMARLLRLAKTVRLFKRFKEFWILVRGFMQSLPMVMWTTGLLLLTIYVCSCITVELVTMNPLAEEDEVFQETVEMYFASLPLTMLSLMRFATLDNTSEMYMPLVKRDPMLAPLFIGFALVLSLSFFHIIGAVLFSSTLEQNLEEDESIKQNDLDKWYQLVKDLKDLFHRLDKDGSGNLSIDEFMSIHPSDMRTLQKALGSSKTPTAVFHALDIDHSGEVSIKEFWDGIWDLISMQNGLDVKRMEKQVEIMHFRLKDIQQSVSDELRDMGAKIDGMVNAQADNSSNPILEFRGGGDKQNKILKKLQHVWTESLQTALNEMTMSSALGSDDTLATPRSNIKGTAGRKSPRPERQATAN